MWCVWVYCCGFGLCGCVQCGSRVWCCCCGVVFVFVWFVVLIFVLCFCLFCFMLFCVCCCLFILVVFVLRVIFFCCCVFCFVIVCCVICCVCCGCWMCSFLQRLLVGVVWVCGSVGGVVQSCVVCWNERLFDQIQVEQSFIVVFSVCSCNVMDIVQNFGMSFRFWNFWGVLRMIG